MFPFYKRGNHRPRAHHLSQVRQLANYSPILRQDPSECYNQSPVNYEVFRSHSWWEETLFTALCEHWLSILRPFQVVFLSLGGFAHLQSLAKISWIFCGTILKMSIELFLYENSPFQHSVPMNHSCCSLPRLSAIPPRLRVPVRLCVSSSCVLQSDILFRE